MPLVAGSPSWVHCDRRTTRFSDANGTHWGWNVERGLVTTFRMIGPGRAGRSLMASARRCGGLRVTGHARAWRLDRATPPAASTCWSSPPPTTRSRRVAAMVSPGGRHRGHPPVGLPRPRRARRPPAGAARSTRWCRCPTRPSGRERLPWGSPSPWPATPMTARVARALGGGRVEVADGDRAAYHAAASIAANHLVALIGQVERVAATVGLAPRCLRRPHSVRRPTTPWPSAPARR